MKFKDIEIGDLIISNSYLDNKSNFYLIVGKHPNDSGFEIFWLNGVEIIPFSPNPNNTIREEWQIY